jgi:FkbM family methyltransferase
MRLLELGRSMDSSAPIVIFGAGNLGRRVAKAIPPVLFCDNNPALWGTAYDGTPIESPETAVRRYPSATFINAIWHPSRTERIADRTRQLESLGASNVLPFSSLFADYGDALLPDWFWERPAYYAQHEHEIQQARALMDPNGCDEFDRQMRLRLADPSDQVIDSGVQYFPNDLFQMSRNEVFVDCGAYDGDTIAEFRRATGDQFVKIVAFEPDPQNFLGLKSAIRGDPRITLHPYATGSLSETVRFTIGGTASKISSTGTCEVEVVTLDDVLEYVAPTYVKLDIEGSEPATIEGGSKTIARHRPKMAVCLYHAPDHLWSIPLRLNELLPDSRFTLRTYVADGWECVCYCIPR